MLRADARARVHALVDAILDAIEQPAPDSTTYSTMSLPPLTSRRTFTEVCRSGKVHGARRDGRTWVCPRDEWHHARARRPQNTLRLVEAPATDEQLADALISRAGFRSTRGAK